MMNGIFLSILRFYEPFFKFHFLKEIKALYGIIHNKKLKIKTESLSLSTFLSTSLNFELVHIILKAIK